MQVHQSKNTTELFIIHYYDYGSIMTTYDKTQDSWRITNMDMDVVHSMKKVYILQKQLHMTCLCNCLCDLVRCFLFLSMTVMIISCWIMKKGLKSNIILSSRVQLFGVSYPSNNLAQVGNHCVRSIMRTSKC